MPVRRSQLMSEPLSMLDVDEDLWSVLDLCSDEELELLYATLHSSSPFSPVRDMVTVFSFVRCSAAY